MITALSLLGWTRGRVRASRVEALRGRQPSFHPRTARTRETGLDFELRVSGGVGPLEDDTVARGRWSPYTPSMGESARQPPKLIAEIGCNHCGDMEIARELIRTAAIFCKADAVKLQKRCNVELLSNEQYNAPHPVPGNAYGDSYGAHREYLEFDVDQHRELAALCAELGITYACSVWDVTSAREIASLQPEWIKIPSACNTHLEMLGWLCENYSGQIHASLGMTTRAEERALLEFFRDRDRIGDLVLYACTSGYPVPPEDICLLEISRLISTYGHEVAAIGFSGHHLGIAADVAAMTLGATWVERHYTLDRTWKGTDHAASLEPDGVRRLARDLRSVSRALTSKPSELLAVEQANRDKLKWRARAPQTDKASAA